MRSATVLILASLVLAPLFPGSARADNEEKAASLVRAGLELRRTHEDEKALAMFEQAWDLTHGAEARAQMGLAEMALGRWADAARDLDAALDAKGDAWIEKHRKELASQRGRVSAHLGTLDVRANVAGAELRVNDKVVGRLPLASPIVVEAGTAKLTVSADGFVPITRAIAIEPATLNRETVELVGMSALPAAAARSATEPATVPPTPPSIAAAPAPRAPPPPRSYRKAGIALAIGGAVVAVAGGALLATSFATMPAPADYGNVVAYTTDGDRALDERLAGAVLAAAGVAAVVGGVVTTILSPREHGRRSSQSIRILPQWGPAQSTVGLALAGSF